MNGCIRGSAGMRNYTEMCGDFPVECEKRLNKVSPNNSVRFKGENFFYGEIYVIFILL